MLRNVTWHPQDYTLFGKMGLRTRKKLFEFFLVFEVVVYYAKEMIVGITVNNDECYLVNIDEEFGTFSGSVPIDRSGALLEMVS